MSQISFSGEDLRQLDEAVAALIGNARPSEASAIVGAGLPSELGDAGPAVFGGPMGLAYAARWRRKGPTVVLEFEALPMPTGAAPAAHAAAP